MGVVQRLAGRLLQRKGEDMIRITQLKLPVDHREEDLRQQIARKLRCPQGNFSWKIVRQSLDARHKDDKKFVYTVDVSVENEKKILRKVHDNNIMLTTKKEYRFPLRRNMKMQKIRQQNAWQIISMPAKQSLKCSEGLQVTAISMI